MLWDELSTEGHVQQSEGPVLFRIPHPREILYDLSVLDKPTDSSSNQENAGTANALETAASDGDVSEEVDDLSDVLAPSKIWVPNTESNVLWIEQMRSCFLPDNDALLSSIVHAVQDPQSLFLNEFAPRSLHTEPYRPSIDSIYSVMKQTESSKTIGNDADTIDEPEVDCKEIVKRQIPKVEKLPTMSGSKGPVQSATQIPCEIRNWIPKHASCKFWSTSHMNLKLSKKFQQCESREPEETKEKFRECLHCICSAVRSNGHLVSEYDIWQELPVQLSNPSNALNKQFRSVPANPLPYCYNPSHVFLRSKLNEKFLFSTDSNSLVIAESGKRIGIRLLLPERTQIFGVPPGQFVILTVQTQCRYHPEDNSSSTERTDDLAVSRPVFPIGACDNNSYVDFMWLHHCLGFDTHHGESVCEDAFGCALRQLGPQNHLTVKGPFGHLLYRGSGCFSFLPASTAKKVTKTYSCVSMIGLGFGMFPLYTVLEQASREMELRTQFNCVQLHANTEPCLLSDQFADIASRTGCCTYVGCKIEFSMDWNLELFENDLSILLPSYGTDTLMIVCAFVPFVRDYLMHILRRLGYLEYDYYSYT